MQRLESEGTIEALKNTIESGRTLYSTSELGIPGLRHFMYKSRAQVQITFPVWEDPYEDPDQRQRYVGRNFKMNS
jgi:vacuolar fusion protein MON1